MKKRIWLIALSLLLALALIPALGSRAAAADPVTINSTNFPDANFRSYVSNSFDSNSDGVLSASELAAVKTIDVYDKNISNMKGIEHFTALTQLHCGGNPFESLGLSKNSALEKVYCYNCPNLKSLNIGNHNALTDLDLQNDASLMNVACYVCNLTWLCVDNCPALETLSCGNNRLKSLDVTDCPKLYTLYCDNNQLTSLDLSQNKLLENLDCSGNQLTELNVSNYNELWKLEAGSNPKLEELYCRNCNLWKLEISDCPALTDLVCKDNHLDMLDLSGCTALQELYCSGNDLSVLDIGDCTALEHLECYDNDLTSLDVSASTQMIYLDAGNNRLSSLDVSKNTALRRLYCGGNDLEELDVDQNKALETIWCACNALTSLDVSGHSALYDLRVSGNDRLKYLSCSNCALTILELLDCTALERLYCFSNHLQTLDVSECTALKSLDCENNGLTALDISRCPSLTYLTCASNNLSALDVSGCPSMEKLRCFYNSFSTLDISNCTQLKLAFLTGTRDEIVPGAIEAYVWGDNDYYLVVDMNIGIITPAPEITTQPKGKTAAAGSTVEFTVAASGMGLKYQWQFCAPGTDTWHDSGMTGAKTPTLSVEATTARNGQKYRCVVTSGSSSAASNAATLTVVSKPSITTQPKSVTATAGSTVKFTVAATGGSLSYQWQFKAPGTSTWNDSGMTGAKTATLSVEATTARNGQQYRCVVKNAAGSVTSNAATLTVGAKPTITTQPQNKTAAAGTTVKFTVAASGSGLSYQWQFKAPGTSTWNDSSMTGAKTATLSVEATTARNGQQYRCVVKNSAGSVTSNAAKLTVVTKPSITTQPKNITAVSGDVVKFTVSATGGSLSYQWQYKSPSSTTWKDSGMTGAKTATLTVTAESARNGQQYRCVVKNAAGTATSNAGKLTVSSSAKPTIMIDPKSVTASADSTVKFTVEASGGSGLKYQWQFKAPGTDTWHDSSMTGAKTATLTVTATAARNGQQYRCVVTNSHGTATSAAAKLTVK